MPRRRTLTGRIENRKSREYWRNKRNTSKKRLTVADRDKAFRLHSKIGSYEMLADLFNAPCFKTTFRSRYVINYYKNHPTVNEPQIDDIIIPSVQLIIKPEDKLLISEVILNNLELLAECVCESLKREQLFTYEVRRKRTKEFADIISKNESFRYWISHVRFECKLRFASEEIPQKFEVLPVPVDLHEILCYCLKKIELKNIDYTKSSGSNKDIDNLQYPTRDFEHQPVNSYSDIMKLLTPITEFASSSSNRNGLESICELKKHISNIQQCK